ncbi:MAG TPA: type II 3-dehydroquinate dehydratase [Lentisphaeria bacterium]|nr:MAG: type II 3-dehydroquinate dehydratase [Lentisphaerae bacterium GWF2_38_69]HBM16464.1 type II 3-dehydroquinate dehydratase [Lentisphaeria bacterium]
MKILIINGPNLQLLGTRETKIYGSLSLDKINLTLTKAASKIKNISIEFFQSNHEGEIIDKIGTAKKEKFDALVINPAAFTHTSYAIYDAIKAIDIPSVEVHLSNIYKREEFRKHSVTAPASIGVISGLGIKSYEYAISYLAEYIKNN